MRIAAGLAFVLLATPAFAARLPAPPHGAVADGAGILTADEIRAAEDAAQALESERHARVVILTIADADGESPKQIAVRALNEWNVGRRSVLLLIQLNPRQLYLQPGTELAPVFDEATSSGICARIVAPEMKAGRRGAAVLAGIAAISSTLAAPGPAQLAGTAPIPRQAPVSVSTPAPRSTGIGSIGVVLLGALACPLLFLMRQFFVRKCPKCSTAMSSTSRVLQQPTYSSKGMGESHFRCPGCNYSFVEGYTIAMLTQSSDSDTWSGGSSSGFDGGSSGGGSSSDGSGGGGSSW